MKLLPALVSEAGAALSANRLRTALTLLGLVIGVASVVLMLAIGEGSRQRVSQTISSLGTDQLILASGGGSVGPLRGATGTLPTLTLDDLAAVAELPGVRSVAPVHNASVRVVAGNLNKTVQLVGTTPAYLDVQQWELVQGRGFTETESRTSANVALLGATVVRELFPDLPPGASPVGQVLRVQRQVVEVVGVLQAKGQGFGGQDQDDVMVLPVTTVQRRLAGTPFPGAVSMGMVRVAPEADKAAVDQQITRLLRQRHRLADGVENDFSVRDLAALSASLAVVSQVLSVLLGSIAFISLLVGGIGVMNIMLVSVTERTREIGLRMALGASPGLIATQFLLEAAWLSAVGAAIGLAVGVGLGLAITATGAVTAVFSTWSLGLSTAVALAVGLGFGFWPAQRAAQLAPAEALRAA